MKHPKSVLEYWLEKIDTDAKGLTKWEENFIESIKEQLEKRGTLSDRQIEILEKIYTEKGQASPRSQKRQGKIDFSGSVNCSGKKRRSENGKMTSRPQSCIKRLLG